MLHGCRTELLATSELKQAVTLLASTRQPWGVLIDLVLWGIYLLRLAKPVTSIPKISVLKGFGGEDFGAAKPQLSISENCHLGRTGKFSASKIEPIKRCPRPSSNDGAVTNGVWYEIRFEQEAMEARGNCGPCVDISIRRGAGAGVG